MLAQHANTLCDVVVRCLHTPRSATVPGELPPDAARRTWSLDRRKQLAFQMLLSPHSDCSNSDFCWFSSYQDPPPRGLSQPIQEPMGPPASISHMRGTAATNNNSREAPFFFPPLLGFRPKNDRRIRTQRGPLTLTPKPLFFWGAETNAGAWVPKIY